MWELDVHVGGFQAASLAPGNEARFQDERKVRLLTPVREQGPQRRGGRYCSIVYWSPVEVER